MVPEEPAVARASHGEVALIREMHAVPTDAQPPAAPRIILTTEAAKDRAAKPQNEQRTGSYRYAHSSLNVNVGISC